MIERSAYDSAIIYFEQAGKLFRHIGDTLRVVQGNVNTGIAYKNIGAYEKAFSISMDAAGMMEKMKTSADLATAYNTLGNTMKDLHRPGESLQYHNRAMTIRRGLNDSTGIGSSLNNIGNVYKETGEYARALQYYLQALEIKRKAGSKRSVVTTIDNIVEAYIGMEQYTMAEQYEQEALGMRDENKDKDGWMTSANRLIRIYVARQETAKAKELALYVAKIADASIYVNQRLKNTLLLKEIYLQEKDYANALIQSGIALGLKDSLFNTDMSTAIASMDARFRVEEKEQQLELAGKNAIIQQQQIGMQHRFLLLLGTIILLLLVVSYLLFLSGKLRKKARERTELLMKELNHRVKNNLQIISDIMNLQTATVDSPKERALIEAGKSRVQSISIVHNLLYRQAYTGNINMQAFISEIVKNVELAFHGHGRQASVISGVDDILLDEDLAIPLGLITNELLTNIYKYSQPAVAGHLSIRVQMRQEGEGYLLLISDDGLAWDVQAARMQSSGLGLLLVDMLVKQLKASWLSCRENEITIHRIRFSNV